ncbi:MAG: MBL fold metallo-hydrolase [DPANN group archaeon]|nr:MBL fold metallo-hydrolase [DPANN group archaeon]
MKNIEITILGTGSPEGMPIMTCDCKWCETSKERLRPSILIKHNKHNIIFDASPDIRHQIIRNKIKNITAIFLTHYHFDHFWGIYDLDQLNWVNLNNFIIYLNQDTDKHLKNISWLKFNTKIQNFNEIIKINGLNIESIKIKHTSYLQKSGYIIKEGNKKVVYIPDIENIENNELNKCKDADILIIDGQYIFGKYITDNDHLGGIELINIINKFEAKKVYLIGFSEHWYKISQKDANKKLQDNINIVSDQTILKL